MVYDLIKEYCLTPSPPCTNQKVFYAQRGDFAPPFVPVGSFKSGEERRWEIQLEIK